MKTIILAGGFGTRLRSIVSDRPKPMALIAGKPFLEHQIRNLKKQGLTDFILAVHYMSGQIKSYFSNGRGLGVNIVYSEEKFPMGTAGAIKEASKYLDDEPFLVLNGDTYTDIDIKKFTDFHKSKECLISMSVSGVPEIMDFGEVLMDGDIVKGFLEKKNSGNGIINNGSYIFDKKVLDFIEKNKKSSLEFDVFPKLAEKEQIRGYLNDCFSIDIGKPETHEKFKKRILTQMIIEKSNSVKEAIKKITENGVDLLLVVDNEDKLLGMLNNRIIIDFLISGGNIHESVINAMVIPKETATILDDDETIKKIFLSGVRHLPILDTNKRVHDIKFAIEEIKEENFPTFRGKAPLRISFSGGGTDVPNFFEKYGGIVINSTINQYCYASAKRRADNKVVINSDLFEKEIIFDVNNIIYNGELDLVKAIIKLTDPKFGMELTLYNDIPPGRGLGSSATFAILLVKLINRLKGNEFNDEEVTKIAFDAERSELGIKGGLQDQHASITGGFSFMEFSKEKNIIYPLRLKSEVIKELEGHLLLCYVGKTHNSGEIHEDQAKKLNIDEVNICEKMNEIKKIAIEIKDNLLANKIDRIGALLHESWMNKRKISLKITEQEIDELYTLGIENGAEGGKLLGAGGGGYILFFCKPEKRNQLQKALEKRGCEVKGFSFESEGTTTWQVKESNN